VIVKELVKHNKKQAEIGSGNSLNRKNYQEATNKEFFRRFADNADNDSENRKVFEGLAHVLNPGLVAKEKFKAREIVPLINLVNDNKNKQEFLQKAAIEMMKGIQGGGRKPGKAATMPAILKMDAVDSPTKKFIIKNSSPRHQRSQRKQFRAELVADDLSITVNSLETSGNPKQNIFISENLDINNLKCKIPEREPFDL
jgi:hypothetical protein